jgi:sugar-specific transcriptional regulator TrmB
VENSHKNLVNMLVDVGLGEHQAAIYLAALEIGGGTVLELANQSRLERTGIYYHLESLVEMDLLQPVTKGKKQLYFPADPAVLDTILKDQRTSLAAILPNLESKFKKLSSQPETRAYQGKEQLSALYNDIKALIENTKEEILVFARPTDLKTTLPGLTILLFEAATGIILPRSEKKTATLRDNQRFVANKYFDTTLTTLLIVGNTVITLDIHSLSATMTTQKNQADAWRSLYTFMWDNI